MPRLQILQHKSYHPYLEKNKQRVREDEAKARAEEAELEQIRIDSESSARLDVLRQRAGSPGVLPPEDDNLPSTSSTREKGESLLERHRKAKAKAEKAEKKQKARLDFDFPSETARKEERVKQKEREKNTGRAVVDSYDVDEDGREAVKWETNGHLNLFADLEKAGDGGPSLGQIAKPKTFQERQKDDPFTMYLGRPDRETKPWYTDRELRKAEEKETGEEAEIRRERDKRKDKRSKDRHDPLTHINSLLSKHPPSRHSHPTANRSNTNNTSDPHSARLAREQSERQRALALIAKSKTSWDETPSSVGGGDRSWIDSFEREKDRAGQRYFGNGGGGGSGFDQRGRTGRRSWEV